MAAIEHTRLLLGMITETGQQLRGPDLKGWMAEIGAWYEKQGATGTLADPARHGAVTPVVMSCRHGDMRRVSSSARTAWNSR